MTSASPVHTWFCGGNEFYPAMLAAIRAARTSVELETYIFSDDAVGREFLAALIQATQNGARVRVLVDSFGSITLAEHFFAPLRLTGGLVHFFNPLRFHRFGVRDHRKLLICDRQTVFIGGANISAEYRGDGLTQGWFDTVTRCNDKQLAAALASEFDRLFSNAEFATGKRRKLRAFRPLRHRTENAEVFAIKPGRGAGNFQRALQTQLANARNVDLITPYFLPRLTLRKLLRNVVARGGRVRLLLPGVSDVPIARMAAMVYYARLLRAGVEIYEYEPQILHAKVYRVDETVFAGSSNLDVRSLKLNYELMARFTDRESVNAANAIFEKALKHSRRIEARSFRKSLSFWQRWKNRWAHFLLTRIDPFIALRHYRD